MKLVRARRIAATALIVLFAGALPVVGAQAPAPAAGVAFAKISESDAKEWLTYLSSDALQGREVFTEGYGLAAAYIADRLREMGVKPLGDGGSYFQSVKQRGYRVTSSSSVTVEVGGETRTFKQGDHVAFPLESGGNQALRFSGAEFVGYGQGTAERDRAAGDFTGRDVKGKLVVYLPGRGGAADRSNDIVRSTGAGAVLTFDPALVASAGTSGGDRGRSQTPEGGRVSREGRNARGPSIGVDLTTVERVDRVMPPTLTADETFFEFLFGGAQTSFSSLRPKSDKGDPLPGFTLPNVTVTVNVVNTFTVVSTELTENVVGMVEGSDSRLRYMYVFFGAHLDHVGYAQGDQPKGRVNTPLAEDRIWNGADDDGSGSTGLLGIAKAFATGPRPRRSVVFVWHAGEELGMLGSRYMADFPVVPLDKIQAEFNIDMIGRNRDDKDSEANTLYMIGADRISTDLHNLVVATNASLPRPFKLDFEFNDAADVNTFYTRSDHYSYASKGIPIAFFFTGTHDDYHANTDSVDKILFPKLVRVAEMIYRAGFSLANTDRVLERDNLGPRSGRGFSGQLPKATSR